MKRLLGYWETTCHFAHDLLYGTGNVVACAEITGILCQTTFHQTLKLLFQRHPLLRAVINSGKEGLAFELIATFADVPIIFSFYENEQQRQTIADAEMDEMFSPRKNLWRIKLLQNNNDSTENHLLITAHHSIADAISLVNFMHEFLDCYSKLLKNAQHQLTNLPLQSNIEKVLVHENLINQDSKIPDESITFDPMPFQEFANLGQRYNRNIYKKLDPEQFITLANTCKQQQVTINSLLNGIMLKTAALMQNTTISTTFKTPINLRKHCQPTLSTEHFGSNVFMIRTIHENISPTANIWNLAKVFQQQLNYRIPQLNLLPRNFDHREFDLLELLNSFEMHNAKRRKHFLDSFGISNIGKISLAKNYGNLTLKSFSFSTNRHAGDFALFANVVTLHDVLGITFTYTSPLLQEIWVQKFVECYWQLLLSLCRDAIYRV